MSGSSQKLRGRMRCAAPPGHSNHVHGLWHAGPFTVSCAVAALPEDRQLNPVVQFDPPRLDHWARFASCVRSLFSYPTGRLTPLHELCDFVAPSQDLVCGSEPRTRSSNEAANSLGELAG